MNRLFISIRTIVLLFITFILLWSCEHETDTVSQLKCFDTFTVSIENNATKVQLDNEANVKWDIGDRIVVFSDIQGPQIYTRDEDGKFRGESVQGNIFYAYPLYSGSDWYFYNSISYNPNNPTVLGCLVRTGFFNSEEAQLPMVAKSTSNQLSFKQTGGILHFRMKGDVLLSDVFLKNIDLFTEGNITFNDNNPVLSLTEESIGGIEAICPSDMSDSGYWECYFYLPPIFLSSGVAITISGTDKKTGNKIQITKNSSKPLTISRGEMYSFPVFDIESEAEMEASEIAREREILMKLYQSTDGDNWYYNTNWGSDLPLGSWYGVQTTIDGKFVTKLNLRVNHLCGELPQDVWSLPYLEELLLFNNRLTIRIPNDVNQISGSIKRIDVGNYDAFGQGEGPAVPLDDKDNIIIGGIPKSFEKLSNLSYFSAYRTQLIGIIPDELWQSSLQEVHLGNNFLEGELSPAIANAKSLESLDLINNKLGGIIPEEICELENLRWLSLGNSSFRENNNSFTQLPDNIGKLKNLMTLEAGGNSLRGEIPLSLYDCTNLTYLDLGSYDNNNDYYNFFDCELPEEFGNLINLEYLSLFSTGIKGGIPDSFNNLKKLRYCDLTGEYDSKGHRSANSLSGPLPDISGMENLQKLFLNKNYLEGNIPEHYADIPELTLQAQYNCLSGELSEKILNAANFPNWSISPQRDGYGLTVGGLYESTDYSRDGTVIPIQLASKGAGINVVVMGDAFADYQIADGTYDKAIRKGIEQFFAIEPYSSYRDCFNVYEVEVVSKNNEYMGTYQSTALETYFGNGTTIKGNDWKCRDYADLALGNGDEWQDALIIVILNREYYAGTCYMYHVLAHDALGVDYGNGFSVAYLPLGTDEDMFRGLVQHEAGGHGFAKLADEYYYEVGGYFDFTFYDSTNGLNWYPNIDLNSNPNEIKWKEFLDDDYYIDEGIGIFEGGATLPTGIWRPTESSIMRYNTGEYNAPSRRAIWKRINKLAYGNDWEFSYEGFVNYDMSVRSAASSSNQNKTKIPTSLLRRYPPLAPPVVRTVDEGFIQRSKAPLSTQRSISEDEKQTDIEMETYTVGNVVYQVKGNTVSSYTIRPVDTR